MVAPVAVVNRGQDRLLIMYGLLVAGLMAAVRVPVNVAIDE